MSLCLPEGTDIAGGADLLLLPASLFIRFKRPGVEFPFLTVPRALFRPAGTEEESTVVATEVPAGDDAMLR